MQEWTNAPAKFRFTEDSAADNGLDTRDMGPWNGWLALTQPFPEQPGTFLQDVQILVNTYYHWDPTHPTHAGRDPTGSQYVLETVLKHELGHALYLGHDPQNPNSVMHPKFYPGQRKSLSADDIAGLKHLYP